MDRSNGFSIARALSNNPDIILADEPTGALDKDTGDQILVLLDSIAKRGILVITVTHSQKVADYGSRIVRKPCAYLGLVIICSD